MEHELSTLLGSQRVCFQQCELSLEDRNEIKRLISSTPGLEVAQDPQQKKRYRKPRRRVKPRRS